MVYITIYDLLFKIVSDSGVKHGTSMFNADAISFCDGNKTLMSN